MKIKTAVVLFVIVPVAAFAQGNTKAPKGSMDDKIKTVGICYGQALGFGKPLKEFFSKASTDAKVYLTPKMMLVANQIDWGVKYMDVIGKAVEDPDTKLLEASISAGDKAGGAIFEAFESCLTQCSDKTGNDLNICSDACLEAKGGRSYAVYKACEDAYRKSMPRKQ